MKVNELFYSIQGEGVLAGVPSFFIRLAGCPLRCGFCDTKYAWDFDAGDEYSIQQIFKEATKHPTRHIVITGGEPLVNSDIVQLTEYFQKAGYHITIETSGIISPDGIKADLMSISPKMANSRPNSDLLLMDHEKLRINLTSLKSLLDEYDYQLKFVVKTSEDLEEVQLLLDQLDSVNTNKVLLMPQSSSRVEYLQTLPKVVSFCLQTGYRLTPRLHLAIWDKIPGK